MENDRDVTVSKNKSFGGFLSPLNSQNFSTTHRYSSKFDPYASDSSDNSSPLLKYFLSAEKAANSASPPLFSSTVNVEEDVIVMDGIPINKFNKGGGEVKKRSPLAPFNSLIAGLGRSNSASSSPSGSNSRGIGSEKSRLHKHRLCRFWESTGICQFGFECQFAHGKEELRPNRLSSKIKHEILELNNILEGSNSSYGSKSPTIIRALPKSSITIKKTTLLKSDWTPEDDGIQVCSEKNVNSYITKVLYGTPTRKRLPVFVGICPDP